MTLSSSIALFIAMIILALIPGPGVLCVTARSSLGGFAHGVSTTAGIVAGDYVFISFALAGLATLSSILGDLFYIIKYVGAAYLVWLGVSLFISSSISKSPKPLRRSSHVAGFSAGLVTTLGNPKAILFYISFFPAFLDLTSISVYTAILIYLIATVSVGGVMLIYAYLATKAASIFVGSIKNHVLKNVAGTTLIGSGIYVATRA